MNAQTIKNAFETHFDLVGVIKTKTYNDQAKKLNLKVAAINHPTMVVLGLKYPYRILKPTKTHLVPSFYTFGSDYHHVLKNRIKKVMDKLNIDYEPLVDNHPHNERLAALSANLGFFGKNQLIINSIHGSYFFLGMVLLNINLDDEIILDLDEDCGTCTKCIEACPTHALYEGGYDVEKCISHYNQTKRILTDDEIKANYQLFGCDICQMVCPKNINITKNVHPEFELSGKEIVSINDLFTLSEKRFKELYKDMSYLWKGKTLLMRNAIMLLQKRRDDTYNDLIQETINQNKPEYYVNLATRFLESFKDIK